MMNERRVHIYNDDNGHQVAQKIIEKSSGNKKFCCWQQLVNGAWVNGTDKVFVPLYRAGKLLNITAPNEYENAILFIVEGEKDVETMERLGFHATTTPAGSWKPQYDKYIRRDDLNIVILSDNDTAGEEKARRLYGCVKAVHPRVRWIKPTTICPDCPNKGDISDIADILGDKRTVQAVWDAVNDPACAEDMGDGVTVTCLADVRETTVKWLWYPYIPAGKITIIMGDPGTGKTTLSAAITAIVTNGGTFPVYQDYQPLVYGVVDNLPRATILQNAEDGYGDTIKPRLSSAGADLNKVFFIDETIGKPLSFTDTRLIQTIERYKPVAVFIDPIQAYLVAAIIAKRGRLNDFWNKAYYPQMSYVDMAQMPIVIATSSIALQKAILTEYIPELSKILMAYGIIKTPISAVLRKGREHYVCDLNLRSCFNYEKNGNTKQTLRKLLTPKAPIDIAEIEGLDRYTQRKIAVPDKCVFNCPHRDSCAYLRFRNYANSPSIDIQVVNHNYFLADMKFRAADKRPLIPNYQTVIIDEAHKFLSAARTMFGSEFSSFTPPVIKDTVYAMNFKRESAQKLARKKAKKLYDENKQLFKRLNELSRDDDTDDDATRFTAVIDRDVARHLRNLRDIADTLYELLASEPVTTSGEGKKADILWDLAAVREQLASLAKHNENICWLEKPNMSVTAGTEQEIRLCAIPQNLNEILHKNLWSRGIPTILTSGTLSAGGDFTHIKRTLGLERLGGRLIETTKPSPFNHRENAMLYISEKMPFPDQSNRDYINDIAIEVEKLTLASNGHAAVLFTSYKAMDMVWEILKGRWISFPMFRLDKGGVREIERFKRSGNGVLFASGALWEGIDIPGDTLSMLIIVKLPFQVPDPIGEYEQTLYKDMFENSPSDSRR